MPRFNKFYFIITTALFLTEVLIALYIRDGFVRPYLGDYLVVMLIYAFLMSFFRLPVLPVAIGVLLFAYLIELLQYLDIVERLGLGHMELARVLIGTSFHWFDILAYTLGVITLLFFEYSRAHQIKYNRN